MAVSRLVLLVFISLISPLSYAIERAPLYTTWCSALLGSHDSEAKVHDGTTMYGMRDVSIRTQHALEKLQGKPKRLAGNIKQKLKELLKGRADFEAPHTYPIRTIIVDPNDIKVIGEKEVDLEKITGRMKLLEEDITSMKPDVVSFGHTVTGTENIRNYLEVLKKTAMEQDEFHTAAIEKVEPYYNAKKLYWKLWGRTAMYLYLMSYFLHDVIGHVTSGDFGISIIPAALATSFFYSDFQEHFWETLAYENGFVSRDGRIKYENEFNPLRATKPLTQVNSLLILLQLKDKAKNSLAYHGYAAVLPVEVVNELLAASKDNRAVSEKVIVDSLDKLKNGMDAVDTRYFIVDQIFYHDADSGEPVLLNFVRIKKAMNYAQKNSKKQDELKKAVEEEAAKGLAPVAIPGR